MLNHFCKTPLWEASRTLVDVAQGRKSADTVIKGAILINVCTHEYIKNTDVAIAMGRIAMVGDCSHCIGKDTKVIDAKGKYLAPAFMDGHIHIESSMIAPSVYAKAVVPHGTSVVFMDPHEIYNVSGQIGVDWMLKDAANTPLKAILTAPSCVPAVPGFEDTGSFVGPDEIKKAMEMNECVGLGEMMNFPGILASDATAHAIVGETLKAGKIATGHYSIPETGKGLNAYVASGIRNCHESVSEEEALAKMRLGMYCLFREGSAWHDLQEVGKAIRNHKIDTRFACLCSDDAHPHTIIGKGHLDHIIKRAIEDGIDPITAIQMVTINIAQCYQLDHEFGSVAPSKCADLVLIDDINNCHVVDVWINGEHVAHNGKMLVETNLYPYPNTLTNSVHLTLRSESDFVLKHSGNKVKIRAIEVTPGKVGTNEYITTLDVKDGEIQTDPNQDILKAFVFERHHETGTVGIGFLKGFGIKNGALAQTFAHDAHNLLVVGSNNSDMALAANELIKCGGGMIAVQDGKIIGKVELPIAGLVSDEPIEVMDEKIHKLEIAWEKMGSTLPSPFMTMSIVPLACIPVLRLTNRGLVNCLTFQFEESILD